MSRSNFNDLAVFATVAREKSFTSAAALLGVTTSAVSFTVRGLEERIGVRLLSRTTRSVKTTQAGERLLNAIGPAFDHIDAEVSALSELRDVPAGTVRINASEHAARTVLVPAIARLLPKYPDIEVEITVSYGLVDIVAERYDAGVRRGRIIDKDMVAVPIGPKLQWVVVGNPDYFKDRAVPEVPADLMNHSCVNLRLQTQGGLMPWRFEKDGQETSVRVGGPLVCNTSAPILDAALHGLGLAYLPKDAVQTYVDRNELIQILSDWTPPHPGFHLYYPSSHQHTAAFRVVLEALRFPKPPAVLA